MAPIQQHTTSNLTSATTTSTYGIIGLHPTLNLSPHQQLHIYALTAMQYPSHNTSHHIINYKQTTPPNLTCLISSPSTTTISTVHLSSNTLKQPTTFHSSLHSTHHNYNLSRKTLYLHHIISYNSPVFKVHPPTT